MQGKGQEFDLIRDRQLSLLLLNKTLLQYTTPVCQRGMCTEDPQINMFLKEMQNNPREAQKQMMSDRLQLMGYETGARRVHVQNVCLKWCQFNSTFILYVAFFDTSY